MAQKYFLVFVNTPQDLEQFQEGHNLVVLLDSNCSNYTDFIHSVSNVCVSKVFSVKNFQGLNLHILTESNYWILFHNNQVLPEYVPVSSHFYVVSLQENYKFILSAFFNYSTRDLGVWSSGKGFEKYTKLTLPGDRLDLNGAPLRVAYYYSSNESLLHLTDFR